MKQEALALLLAAGIAVAAGCGHENGPAPAPEPTLPPPAVAPPSAVSAHAGEGPIPVFGASVYSPGQEIYKELRQEDSLMAFLACQGEPDRLEVQSGDDPGDPPRILLEYTRRSVDRGTVEIVPTGSGYYAARPLDPSGRLTGSAKPAEATRPSRPAPPPKPARTPSPEPAPKAAPTPAPEPLPEAARPEPALPQPTPAQHDECPIEPWRSDCRDLCGPGASWEWCSYRD